MSQQEEGGPDGRVSTAPVGHTGLEPEDGAGGPASLRPRSSAAAGVCRLQKLQKDIETAQHSEDHHLQVLQESESLLQAKKAELEKLRRQVGKQMPWKTGSCCFETHMIMSDYKK